VTQEDRELHDQAARRRETSLAERS
jgi:hypothetical protein